MYNKEIILSLVCRRRNKAYWHMEQWHKRYLKQNHRILYMNLLTSDKLNGYLADINTQAENMFFRIVKELAEKENVT